MWTEKAGRRCDTSPSSDASLALLILVGFEVGEPPSDRTGETYSPCPSCGLLVGRLLSDPSLGNPEAIRCVLCQGGVS